MKDVVIDKQWAKLEWAEMLPPNCPPQDARQPNNERFFRLVDSLPPTAEDFYSQRRLYPSKQFSNECRALAVSLFGSYTDCQEKKKLPNLKQKMVVGIVLPPESGVILKTVRTHYAWWMAKHFDPVPCCRWASDLGT
jgi:hypothetical protein